MGNLLFSPSGRIGSSDFQKGALILIVLAIILSLPGVLGLPEGISTVIELLGIVLIWCWIALWIKRYHDAGKSGWMSLIPIILYIVIFIGVIFGYAGNEIGQLMAAATDPDAAAEAEAAFDAKTGGIAFLAISAVISAVIALGFNAMIKSDPDDNQFGPAT